MYLIIGIFREPWIKNAIEKQHVEDTEAVSFSSWFLEQHHAALIFPYPVPQGEEE